MRYHQDRPKIQRAKYESVSVPQENFSSMGRQTLTPVKLTGSPSFVTTNDLVGSLSSSTVPYLRILTASEPVLVTVALMVRSSMEETAVDGPATSTVIPSNRLNGLARTSPAKLKLMARSEVDRILEVSFTRERGYQELNME